MGVTGNVGQDHHHLPDRGRPAAAGRTAGLIGTVGVRIDGTDLPSALTTPEAPALQALLAVMRERGVDTTVMEVSSHALSLGRVDGCASRRADSPTSRDHLISMPDDGRLLRGQGPAVRPGRTDVQPSRWCASTTRPAGRWHSVQANAAITVSAVGLADWTVEDVTDLPDGSQEFFAVDPARGAPSSGSGCRGATTSPIVLWHWHSWTRWGGARTGRARPARCPVPGRLEPVERGQDFLALVDYAHCAGRAARGAFGPCAARPTPGASRWCSARAAIAMRASGSRWAPSPPNWPIWWSSPTTTRATRIPRPSGRPCSVVRPAVRRSPSRSATAGPRSTTRWAGRAPVMWC